MFDYLNIVNTRERWVVGVADMLLWAGTTLTRAVPSRAAPRSPSRILLLRLERIGDLLMTLSAIAAVRACAPDAEIHLVVGSWNAPIASLIPAVDRVEVLDAPWLARGTPALSVTQLIGRALAWRRRRYDLAINFEGDLRGHLLMWLSAAPRRVGFPMGGGGPVLTQRVEHRSEAHTATNALRLVARAFDRSGGAGAAMEGAADVALSLPANAGETAARLLDAGDGTTHRGGPLVGLHASSGGRAVKQWPPDRFAETARYLIRTHGATIVLTGTSEDSPLAGQVRRALPRDAPVIDLVGRLDLVTLAAVLQRLSLFISGDTGPLHLASAVGTPTVGIFGPSDPARYRPTGSPAAIVRVDLPCSPCNRIRRPPARCTGRTPDCLTGVSSDEVAREAGRLLLSNTQRRASLHESPETGLLGQAGP